MKTENKSVLAPVSWKLRQIVADRHYGISPKQLSDRIAKKHPGDHRYHENTIRRWLKSNQMPQLDGVGLAAIAAGINATVPELLGFDA